MKLNCSLKQPRAAGFNPRPGKILLSGLKSTELVYKYCEYQLGKIIKMVEDI